MSKQQNEYRIDIRETTAEDLENILALWNNGEVTRYVGFPDGIGVDMAYLRGWLSRVERARPRVNHYSVYCEGIGYCGETYYRIDPAHDNAAALDIKLLPRARGKGIAARALTFATERAFFEGASLVYVDPNPENEKALALYRRLGFTERPMPEYLREGDEPEAIYFERKRPD